MKSFKEIIKQNMLPIAMLCFIYPTATAAAVVTGINQSRQGCGTDVYPAMIQAGPS